MGYIDLIFYVSGIAALSVLGFNFGRLVICFLMDEWFPYVRVTVSHTDKQGVKRSKAIWLDKIVPEDKELIDIIDSVKNPRPTSNTPT